MVKEMRLAALVGLALLASRTNGAAGDGAILRCGASEGTGYFFRHAFWYPEGPSWEADKISNGEITLVHLGDEWDILLNSAAGVSGYREEGVTVSLMAARDQFLMVGAFSAEFVEIYTFDLEQREVAWTSNRIGPLPPKAAVYRAECK